jgi:hypothetical protein
MMSCVKVVLSSATIFFVALTTIGTLFLYVTFVVPPGFWLGSVSGANSQWQGGGALLSFFSNEFFTFVVIPFAPLILVFLFFAAGAWIFLRAEPEISHKGFLGITAAAFTLALFILLPARSSILGHEVEALRQSEVARLNPDGFVRMEHRTDREALKIYRALHEAGIATWRGDPLAVVKFELTNGDLRHLHEADDELILKSFLNLDDGNFSEAVVNLINRRVKVQINLQSGWSDEHRVWLVHSYRPLTAAEIAVTP